MIDPIKSPALAAKPGFIKFKQANNSTTSRWGDCCFSRRIADRGDA